MTLQYAKVFFATNIFSLYHVPLLLQLSQPHLGGLSNHASTDFGSQDHIVFYLSTYYVSEYILILA